MDSATKVYFILSRWTDEGNITFGASNVLGSNVLLQWKDSDEDIYAIHGISMATDGVPGEWTWAQQAGSTGNFIHLLISYNSQFMIFTYCDIF